MKAKKRITFIGAGNMGEALIRGILAAGLFDNEDITAVDLKKERREEIARRLKIAVAADNREAVKGADIVVLSIKPQNAREVIEEIAPQLSEEQLLVSIMAGIPSSLIEKKLNKNLPVVRVMPNTPALVQAGVAAISGGRFAREEHLALVERILKSVGKVVRLPEEMMNAVTAVSGSGPAYVFLFTEALSEASRKLGISKQLSDTLAIQTVIGAAKLLEKTGLDPARLRQKVTSPGGTTEAALGVLREKRFNDLLKAAVGAACQRAAELEEAVDTFES